MEQGGVKEISQWLNLNKCCWEKKNHIVAQKKNSCAIEYLSCGIHEQLLKGRNQSK